MRFTTHHGVAGREADARPEPGGRNGWLAAAALSLAVVAGCNAGDADAQAAQGAEQTAEAAPLANDAAKASYSIGYRFAENVRRQFPDDIDNDAFVRGVTDLLANKESAVDAAEAERVLSAMMEAHQAKAASESLHNLEAGLDFLKKNGKRDGVTTTESGLQYQVLREGEGDKPGPTDTVTTHYEGRLIDGTIFDSSYKRGQPATFPLNRVIAGWTEGLQLMSPGSKYRFFVPADLAYGDKAVGPVPANSTLIFDVELLKVGSAEAGTPSADTPQEGGADDKP